MTVDRANQRQDHDPAPMLPLLALVFAGLTLVFALLSMIVGNRSASIQARFVADQQAEAVNEAASIEALQTAAGEAATELEAARKALAEEKASSGNLKQQLSVAMKDLEKTKSALAEATRIIAELRKSASLAEPAPADASPSSEPTTPSVSPIDAPSPSTGPTPAAAAPPNRPIAADQAVKTAAPDTVQESRSAPSAPE